MMSATRDSNWVSHAEKGSVAKIMALRLVLHPEHKLVLANTARREQTVSRPAGPDRASHQGQSALVQGAGRTTALVEQPCPANPLSTAAWLAEELVVSVGRHEEHTRSGLLFA